MGLRRGDILLVDFDPGSPGEVAKVRPAILVTNDVANAYSLEALDLRIREHLGLE
ncbi:type II toxin-antitoxin system PemK/MazF family toxin [Thermus tenuipuniceus]|uniref:type II toxin-antitoxin system PemK/MazF family toxin n=1 Tax=Thermus tenuipuniceus TaxID=2078690 RepID=UPI000CFA199F|nr:type II toxin-antitoxin system PemK/MazF family toxin [Thermus tenuipuniceus]